MLDDNKVHGSDRKLICDTIGRSPAYLTSVAKHGRISDSVKLISFKDLDKRLII